MQEQTHRQAFKRRRIDLYLTTPDTRCLSPGVLSYHVSNTIYGL